MSLDDSEIHAHDLGVMEAKTQTEEIYNDIYGRQNVSTTRKLGGFVISTQTVKDKVDIRPHEGGVKFLTGSTQPTAESRIRELADGGSHSTQNTHSTPTQNPGTQTTMNRNQPTHNNTRDDFSGSLQAKIHVHKDGTVQIMHQDGTTKEIESSMGLIADHYGDIRSMFTDENFTLSQQQIQSICDQIEQNLME